MNKLILSLSAVCIMMISCGEAKKENAEETAAVCKCEHACKTKADCEKNCGPECNMGE